LIVGVVCENQENKTEEKKIFIFGKNFFSYSIPFFGTKENHKNDKKSSLKELNIFNSKWSLHDIFKVKIRKFFARFQKIQFSILSKEVFLILFKK